MSSHMLDKEEFQQISNWLFMRGFSNMSRHAHCIKTFIGFEPGTDEHYRPEEGQMMKLITNACRHLYNLNRLAIVTRYGEKYDRNDDTQFIPRTNFAHDSDRKAIRLLKSLSYQMSEYIVHETETAKELKYLIGRLCENLFDAKENESVQRDGE